MCEVKLGGKLKGRRKVRILGGRHDVMNPINSLDERDILQAIKDSKDFKF